MGSHGTGLRRAPMMSRLASLLVLSLVLAVTPPAGAAPEAPAGQMTWAAHITLAPTWFDPAETPGIGTPFMILYALHDALVKPMPGNPMAPSLAESWSLSKDGLAYEFVLRPGARFHNGDPVTAEDAKFSFERYRGAASKLLREAHEQYWRKVPSVKRLVIKSVQDEATRLAMLKRGEADVIYLLQGELAEDVRRTPGLTLKPTPIVSTHWLVFLDQWDPKSPWADRRVRLAANHAMNRQAVNEALTLRFSRITWSIIPASL